MKIIAESGSTKTDWVILNEKKVLIRLSTSGFNPTYFPDATLDSAIKELTPPFLTPKIRQIYFYGAGCAAESSKKMVKDILGKYFKKATIEVQHDLFGAARALFGNGSGIASILGTGSSSCLFKNNRISASVPSLGFLLADEGSGAHIGGELIKALFYGDFPEALRKKFVSEFEIESGTFIPKLYAREKPNAYIASFVPFAVEHKSDLFIKTIVKKAFRAFFRENTLKYREYEKYDLGFSGSVAFLFSDYLKEIAGEFGLTVSKVIKGPIDELVAYHLNG